MRDRRLEERPGCSVKTSPVPMEITCPHCGVEIEIWSDETEVECKLCGKVVHNTIDTTH